jgi:DNA repair protein RecN (Recombination protein N)
MLTSLYVRQFAVVEEAEIAFGPGLTVVSGETGAGKSLLVDALMLLAGSRADSGMIRAGSDRAELSAEFDLAALPAALAWLRQEELDDGNTCQLRRVIRDGNSRAWINGRPASLAQLSALATQVVEIHGQHEHQALLSRTHQMALLDAYAGTADLLAAVASSANQWRAAGVRIRKLTGGDDRDQRIDLLRHETEELERWTLAPAELEELELSHKRLANAGRLAEGASAVVELIDGESELAIGRALVRAQSELQRLAELDPRLLPQVELIDNAQIQLGEAVDALGRYAQDVDLDPERYAEVDTHLSHLHDLARRYRLSVSDLAGKASELRDELTALEGAGEALEALERDRERHAGDYARAATELSSARTKAAEALGAEVGALMGELGMSGGVLRIMLETLPGTDPDPQGRERCEFEVSTNPGQPPRALRKVASGGELARISLAIEVATLGNDTIGCMVFDEVDTGIGGAVAEVVGQKLRALGERCQVLCVTHLPQVAAQGHAHLRVSKATDGESTRTQIQVLDTSGRRDELSRMLGGVEITKQTRAHARQMLESVKG